MEVVGGKSKRKYTMTVGDRGRSFKDDSGADMSEDDFKAREGDYTTAGGSEQQIASGTRSVRGAGGYVSTEKVAGAPTIAKEGPSLGDVAAMNARKKSPQAQAIANKLNGGK